MHVTAIIAAGGRGQRFGGERLKQLLPVGGVPILSRSVAAFLAHPSVHEVVVALPQALVDDPPDYLRHASKPLRLVAGGERRQDSVANAFRAATAASDVIVIHDAARPFVSADLIARTIAAAAETGAALAAVSARDTVKLALRQPQGEREDSLMLSPHEPTWVVKETLPRESIFLAQTPQAFRRDVLRDALAQRGDATDEAMLAERAGHAVRIVLGEASNIKITTPDDMEIAEAIARSAEGLALQAGAEREPFRRAGLARTGRAGTGYDLHRLVAGRPLVLGGVTIPSDRGALGHSDADVVCHAVTDAILGAACLGDIGRHFPDSDPRWKDASSIDLLTRVATLVREAGFEVGNVDVTVILEAPKIRDHVNAMRAAVARAIGIDPARVSVKGKTNEGVDALGRGEAIAAHAIALIRAI
jgi:2-C-methyl-D-erythritol 4-phosphate cytidylyltransferase/2-C-methyl-D-erythritol 2,4-cyclodiphosphate synthase